MITENQLGMLVVLFFAIKPMAWCVEKVCQWYVKAYTRRVGAYQIQPEATTPLPQSDMEQKEEHDPGVMNPPYTSTTLH